MDIYQTLTTDHLIVKNLLNDLIALEDDNSERRSELVSKIRDEMIPHARAEEAVLYNSMRMIDSSKSLAMHGYKEHVEAELLLRALQTMDKLDTSWRATAIRLQESLEHHITDEETEMFAAARKLFTEEEADAMAETFQNMKPQIRKEGLLRTTLDMFANLMPPRLVDKFRNFDLTQR